MKAGAGSKFPPGQKAEAAARPRPGPEVEATIEKLLPGGLGLARPRGEALLVGGVLPGERVRILVGEKARGARRAVVTEVLEPSPLRRAADCPLAGRCGGCDFIQIDPAPALALKAEAALGFLAESYGLRPQLVPSPLAERYRARATVHLGRGPDGRARLGFFQARGLADSRPAEPPEPPQEAAGRGILEFESCRLLDPELEKALPPLREWAAAHAAALPGPGQEIEVGLMKEAAGPLAAVCFSPPPARRFPRPGSPRNRRPEKAGLSRDFLAALDDLPRFLSRHGLTEPGLWARPAAGAAPQRLSPRGPARLTAAFWPQWDLALKARPGGFTQVNPAVNQLLVEEILRSAGELEKAVGPSDSDPAEAPTRQGRPDGAPPLRGSGPRRALDLYAGLGNISIPLAKSGWEVTAVEEAAEGAEAARENGRGLPNFKVIRGRSEREAEALARAGRRFELIILDPPRSGAKDMAPALGRLGAEMILYVACHPAVLERDLPAFVSLGYRPEKLSAFDMFPRTCHLEALVLLRRR